MNSTTSQIPARSGRGAPRGRRVALAALLLALAAVAGCERGQGRQQGPDVLLVTIDTLRADHCSAYGYPVPTTPVLEKLAGRGVLFRRAYSESSTTGPSHAVLMAGRHFRSLGVRKNGQTVPEDAILLAEAMQEAGYATAAFVSSFPVKARFGFGQGFEVYNDEFVLDEASIGRRKPGEDPHDRLARATLDHFRRWLDGRTDARPLFAWIHFVDPHAPYHAPEKFDAVWPDGSKPLRQRYDAEVRYADRHLGLLLEDFARATPGREDFVVVTSDHGEGLGDHGWMSHGVNLYEEAVRIPLVASWPGRLPEGVVEEHPVSLVDIAPGILAAIGIETEGFDHGVKLFDPDRPRRPVFLQRRDYKSRREKRRRVAGGMTAVVDGGRKLILAPEEERRELYGLEQDPREERNLLSKRRAGARQQREGSPDGEGTGDPSAAEPEASRLEGLLASWERAFPEAAGDESPMDPETLKALRALGYVD